MCGYVRYKGNVRPFLEWREIRRGRRKGWIEVMIGKERKKVVLHKRHFIRFPKEEINEG